MADRDGMMTIGAGGVEMRAEMSLPRDDAGVVVIPEITANGGDPAVEGVAARLRVAGLGVLRLSLLTEQEESEGNIDGLAPEPELLGNRLGLVLDWLDQDDRTSTRPIGIYGTDQAAAAALVAAAGRPQRIGAVVSADGRADLAGDSLEGVAAPTLLIVGTDDASITDATNEAAQRLGAVRQVERLSASGGGAATDAPHAQQQIGDLAADWFTTHLVTLESPMDVPDAEHPSTMRPDRFPPREGRSGRGMST